MDPLRVVVVAVFCLLVGGLVRRLATYDTAPAGYTLFAKYPTRREAEEVRAYLGRHGVRADVDDRRAAVKLNVWHGAVMVYVATEHLERAKEAFAARARDPQSRSG